MEKSTDNCGEMAWIVSLPSGVLLLFLLQSLPVRGRYLPAFWVVPGGDKSLMNSPTSRQIVRQYRSPLLLAGLDMVKAAYLAYHQHPNPVIPVSNPEQEGRRKRVSPGGSYYHIILDPDTSYDSYVYSPVPPFFGQSNGGRTNSVPGSTGGGLNWVPSSGYLRFRPYPPPVPTVLVAMTSALFNPAGTTQLKKPWLRTPRVG